MIDREKVIAGLMMLADRKNDNTCEGLKCCKIAEDALALLKEQEAVEPIEIIDEKYPVGDHNRYKGYRCGKCQEIIPWDANYCPYCGRKVKWDD